ncbi:MAG: hypothetical protein WAM66_09020 [Acidobacteriaceae bacterium]
MADHHNQFGDLERDLRESLSPRSAPEGFAEKVLARVASKSRPALFLHWRSALAAVLIAAVLIAAGLWQRRRQQRIAGEHARAQVMLALRITGSTLDAILQQKIQRTAKEAQP